MGYLRINKVVYSGQKYHFESQEFNKNIVVIEGDNGTGKSTLFNLIYYGLGGEVQSFDKSSDVKHLQITSDLDNYVDLFVTISRNSFVLRRYIGDNDITITPYTIELKKLNDKAEPEKTLNLDPLHLELLRCSPVHPFQFDPEQNNQLIWKISQPIFDLLQTLSLNDIAREA